VSAILTLTMNPGIDKSSRVDNVVPERKLRCERPRYEPGGGGINVSRAIGRLGGKSVALYLAGGRTGQTLGDLLEREGLDHVPVRIEGWNRENLIVREESTGQQFRFGMPGPDVSEIEWQQWDRPEAGVHRRQREPAARRASGLLRTRGASGEGDGGKDGAGRIR